MVRGPDTPIFGVYDVYMQMSRAAGTDYVSALYRANPETVYAAMAETVWEYDDRKRQEE